MCPRGQEPGARSPDSGCRPVVRRSHFEPAGVRRVRTQGRRRARDILQALRQLVLACLVGLLIFVDPFDLVARGWLRGVLRIEPRIAREAPRPAPPCTRGSPRASDGPPSERFSPSGPGGPIAMWTRIPRVAARCRHCRCRPSRPREIAAKPAAVIAAATSERPIGPRRLTTAPFRFFFITTPSCRSRSRRARRDQARRA